MKYCIYILLLILFVPKTDYAQSEYAKLITGKWICEADTSYVVVFTKTTEYSYSNKELDFTFSYELRHDSLITVDKSGKMGVFYYLIENLDKNYLSLTYLEHGNMIIFRREKSNEFTNNHQ